MSESKAYDIVNNAVLRSRTVAQIRDVCWKKCIPFPDDGQTSFGEMSCLDRCVRKWYEAENIVSDIYVKSVELNLMTEKNALEIQNKISGVVGGAVVPVSNSPAAVAAGAPSVMAPPALHPVEAAPEVKTE